MQLQYVDIKYLDPHDSEAGIQLRLLTRMAIPKCERDIIKKVGGVRYQIKAGPSSPRHDHAMIYTAASIFHRIVARIPPGQLDMDEALSQLFGGIKDKQEGNWDLLAPQLPKSLHYYWKLAVRCYAINLALDDAWGLGETAVHYLMHVKQVTRRHALRFLDYQMSKAFIDPVTRPSMLQPVVRKYLKTRYHDLVDTRAISFERWCGLSSLHATPLDPLEAWIRRIQVRINELSGKKSTKMMLYVQKLKIEHFDADNAQQIIRDKIIADSLRWILPDDQIEESELPGELRRWGAAAKAIVYREWVDPKLIAMKLAYIDDALIMAKKRIHPVAYMVRTFNASGGDNLYLIPEERDIARQWYKEFRTILEPHGEKFLIYADAVAAQYLDEWDGFEGMRAEFTADGYDKLFPSDE